MNADSGHGGVLCAGRMKPQRWDRGGGITINHQLNITLRQLCGSFPYKDQWIGDAAIESVCCRYRKTAVPFIEYNRKFDLNRTGKRAGRTGGRKNGGCVRERKEKRQRSKCGHKKMNWNEEWKKTKENISLRDRWWKVGDERKENDMKNEPTATLDKHWQETPQRRVK